MFHPEGPTLRELLEQALASTERGYDLLAPKFDHTPFRTPDPVRDAVARAVGTPRSIDAALDVCCGTGAAMRHLRPLCRERIVGLDFSAGMLAEARRNLEDPGSQTASSARVELVRGDALGMPFEQEFDVVTSAGAFGHIERRDENRFVLGIRRALRPGGRFVFATGEKPSIGSMYWWAAHGFNAVMRARNALRKPPFVMYYLTFLWPEVRPLLSRHGFEVEARMGLCPPPYDEIVIFVARRRDAPDARPGP